MLRAERHRKILSFLKRNHFLGTMEATKLIDSSIATVRRDFAYLESKGEISRIHGGAKLLKHNRVEFSFSEKLNRCIGAKKKIACEAINLIPDESCIYLDAGTTTLQIIEYLPKNIEIVTNSIHIAYQGLTKNLKTILVGGQIKKSTDAMIGPITINQLSQLHFETCFLGVNGVSEKFGYTTPDPEEAIVKQQALLQSDHSYFLADSSKFDKTFMVKVADFGSYPLISENND